MGKKQVICKDGTGVGILYGTPKKFLFGADVGLTDPVAQFEFPCTDARAILTLTHSWEVSIKISEIPNTFAKCSDAILQGLAAELLLDLAPTYRIQLNLSEVVARNKCYSTVYQLYTEYERYDITLYATNGKGKLVDDNNIMLKVPDRMTVHKPTGNKKLLPVLNMEAPCCVDFDDLETVAFSEIALAEDKRQLVNLESVTITEFERPLLFATRPNVQDAAPGTGSSIDARDSQDMLVNLPAERFIIRRAVLPASVTEVE